MRLRFSEEFLLGGEKFYCDLMGWRFDVGDKERS
jgi:hypothetical protein